MNHGGAFQQGQHILFLTVQATKILKNFQPINPEMEEILKNEKTLTDFLGTLNCNNCKYGGSDNCNRNPNKQEEKDGLKAAFEEIGNTGFADNINKHYVCDLFMKLTKTNQ